MLLPHGTIVAVVDGASLELFRNVGNEASPELSPIEAPKFDEHNKAAGARHHSSSANPTGHLLEEDAHVAAVADWLNQQASAQKIEHLVVVAPPRSLGELRRRYDKALTAVLVSELHHELVGRSGREVLAALQQG